MDDERHIDRLLAEEDGHAVNAHGVEVAEAGDLESACGVFRVAASLGNVDAFANLGKALTTLGDPVGAAQAYRAAVESGSTGMRVWLGVLLVDELGAPVDGEEMLRNAYVDGDEDAAHQLALTMLRTDRNDEAIAIIESLPAGERTGEVLDTLSSALRFAARPQESVHAADQAIAAGYEDALLNRAYALDDLESPDAEAAFRHAVDEGVDDADIAYAHWLAKHGRTADAIAHLRGSPDDDPSVLIDLGNLLADSDETLGEALTTYRRAMLLGSIEAMTNLARHFDGDGHGSLGDRLRRQAAAEGDELAAEDLDRD